MGQRPLSEKSFDANSRMLINSKYNHIFVTKNQISTLGICMALPLSSWIADRSNNIVVSNSISTQLLRTNQPAERSSEYYPSMTHGKELILRRLVKNRVEHNASNLCSKAIISPIKHVEAPSPPLSSTPTSSHTSCAIHACSSISNNNHSHLAGRQDGRATPSEATMALSTRGNAGLLALPS